MSEGSIWIFNLFYLLYFGGVWECMIGVVRKIIDVLLFENFGKELMYEVLIIFMVEVCMIINFCLIVLVFFDLENLIIFFLNVLLI